MKFISYGGAPLALCFAYPNWDKDLHLQLELPTNVTGALSNRKSTVVFAESNRYALDYTVDTTSAKQTSDLKLWLLRLKDDDLVAVPLWEDYVEIGASIHIGDTDLPIAYGPPVQYGAEWIILQVGPDPDASVFEIVTVNSVTSSHVVLSGGGATLNWPAGATMFPLLFGKIAERPSFDQETDEVVSGVIKFVENSPFSRRLNVFAGSIPVVGAGVPEFSTLPLFDLQPDYAQQQTEKIESDSFAKRIGFGREDAQFSYEQFNRHVLDLRLLLAGRDEIAKLVRLFSDRRATTKLLMAPTFAGDLRLTQDLPIPGTGNENLITIEPSEYSDDDRPSHPGDPYLALVDPAGVDPQRITVVDAGNLTTAIALAQPHALAETKVSRLILGRFAEAKLLLTYQTDGLVMAVVRILEAPDEYAEPQTDLPPKAYIFKFIKRGEIVTWFTSYERALSFSGATPAPAHFAFGERSPRLKMDREEITIETFDFAGNPLRDVHEEKLEGKLELEIYEVNVANPDDGAAEMIFAGELDDFDPTGKEWKAKFLSFGDFFERNLLNFNISPICAVPVFHPRCALDRGEWRCEAEIASVDGATLDCIAVAGQPDPTGKEDDYFAGGDMNVGAGNNYEARTITHSEAIDGGIRIVLVRPLNINGVVGARFNLWPGCDGSLSMCINRFNNLTNRRAFDFVPDKNPSANMAEVSANAGGKKGQ